MIPFSNPIVVLMFETRTEMIWDSQIVLTSQLLLIKLEDIWGQSFQLCSSLKSLVQTKANIASLLSPHSITALFSYLGSSHYLFLPPNFSSVLFCTLWNNLSQIFQLSVLKKKKRNFIFPLLILLPFQPSSIHHDSGNKERWKWHLTTCHNDLPLFSIFLK